MEECAEFNKYGLLYYSGELSGNERVLYEKHLAGCEACRRELAETGVVLGKLKSTDVLAPSPERTKEIRRMINGKDFSLRRVFWASASAAAILLIVLARFVPSANDYKNENKTPPRPEISAESLKWKNGIDSEISQLKYKIASFEATSISAEAAEWGEFIDDMEKDINELNEQIEEM